MGGRVFGGPGEVGTGLSVSAPDWDRDNVLTFWTFTIGTHDAIWLMVQGANGLKGAPSRTTATRRGVTSLKEPLGAYPRKC
jgi:hypothetical protein